MFGSSLRVSEKDFHISQKPLDVTRSSNSLVNLLIDRAQAQPERIAYTFLQDGETESGELSYQDLDKQARNIAAHLLQITHPGERALLLYPSGLEFISAFFGCLYAGVIAVPAYPPRQNQKLSRLEAIANDAQPSVVLTTTSILANLQQQWTDHPQLAHVSFVPTDDMSCQAPVNWRPQPATSDTLAFLQYTSGSTGTPKGVIVSHGNVLHNSEYIKRAFDLSSNSVSVTWLPSFHDMGLIDGIIQPLYTGFLGVLMTPGAFMQKPIRWLQAISRYGATHCGGPNLGYELCTQKVMPEQQQSLDLSRWCSAYSGAEPVRRQTLEKFIEKFGVCGFKPQFFYPCYGMAEATLMVSGGSVEASPIYCSVQAEALERNRIIETAAEQNVRYLVGCGHTWLDTKMVIVNLDTLTPCLPDQVGEIWVSGSSVAQGYWHCPEQTEHTFQAYLADTGEGPFLRTGDLGFLRNNELFITGRLKEVIIIRGRNYYPQDIEQVAEKSHPALRVNSGAAFSVEVEGQERLIIAHEVDRSYLRKLNVIEIARAIRRAVSEEFDLQVHSILLLRTNSLLKTSSGKIQRRGCRSAFLDGTLNLVGQDELTFSLDTQQYIDGLLPPSADFQQQLATAAAAERTDILRQALQAEVAHLLGLPATEKLDPQVGFFELGMDSLMAMELWMRLTQLLGVSLPSTLVFDFPNIQKLEKYILDEHLVNMDAIKIEIDKKEEDSLDADLLDEIQKLSDQDLENSINQILESIQ
jgi:acyl-CoA synthetase (AMP-forming)/AMP-acid ligase II/acyl carrier protein